MNCKQMLLLTAWLLPLGTVFGANCPELQQVDRARLVDCVRKKYKVPAAATRELAGISLVESTCYRKLQFKSQGAGRPVDLELYLAPDLRFMTRELLDLRVDPAEEERRKRQVLVAGLARGTPPTLGPEDAPVTLTVFSDFQCPYCARLPSMLKEVLPEQEGRVRVIFRHFPLGMHPWAEPAAEAAACAQEQGNAHFWRVHDFVFEHQRELTPKNFAEKTAGYTRTLSGFDQRKFEGCVAEKKTAVRIQQDIAFGNQIGVEGTPTMFVNSEKIGNVVAPEQLRTLIRQYARPAKPSVGAAR